MGFVAINDDLKTLRLPRGVAEPMGSPFTPEPEPTIYPAMRSQNMIGSILAAEKYPEQLQGLHPEKAFDGLQILEMLKGTRYEDQYLDDFVGADSPQEVRARMRQIDREEKDRQALADAGWPGFVAQIAAGTVDPTIAMPGGGIARSVKGGFALAKSARSVGIAGAAAIAVQEAGLQGSQFTRTPEESLMNIGAGTLFAGLLGASVAKWATKAERAAGIKALEEINRELKGPPPALKAGYTELATEDGIEIVQDGKVVYRGPRPRRGTPEYDQFYEAPTGGATGLARPGGAAASDTRDLVPRTMMPGLVTRAYDQSRALLERGGEVPILGKVLGPVGKLASGILGVPEWLIKRSGPLTRMAYSSSVAGKRHYFDMVESPLQFADNEVGIPTSRNGPAVETTARIAIDGARWKMSRELDRLYKEYRFDAPTKFGKLRARIDEARGTTGGKLSYKDWKKEIRDAMLQNDTHDNPQVQAAAQWIRKEIFDPWKEAAIRAKLLPEDVSVKTAESYFTRVYDKQKIIAQRPEFTQEVVNYLTRDQGTKAGLKNELQTNRDLRAQRLRNLRRLEKRLETIQSRQDEVEAKLSERTMESRRTEQRASKLNERVRAAEDEQADLDMVIRDLKDVIKDPELKAELTQLERELSDLKRADKPVTLEDLERVDRDEEQGILTGPLRKAARIASGQTKRPTLPSFAKWVAKQGGLKNEMNEASFVIYSDIDSKPVPGLMNPNGMSLEQLGKRLSEDFPEAFPEPPEEMELLQQLEASARGEEPNWFLQNQMKPEDFEVYEQTAVIESLATLAGIDLKNTSDVADLLRGDDPRGLDDFMIQLNRLEGESNATAASTGAEELRDGGGVPGGTGLLEEPDRSLAGPQGRDPDGSLKGLPRHPGQGFEASVYPTAARVAENYMASRGEVYAPPSTYAKVDPARARRVADAFDKMAHDPQNPEVAAAYKAMVDETLAQYKAIEATGLKVEFIRGEDPYKGNPRRMTEDVRNNNHMWVFSTRDGFGSDATFDPFDNPLLADTQFKISGETATANDIFRVVHDYFGHVKEGLGFRADGEENAWRSHSAMYSPLGRQAMTTETRGQNSWVNYGPHGEANRSAASEATVYADQKIGILPEWAIEDGRLDQGLDEGKPSHAEYLAGIEARRATFAKYGLTAGDRSITAAPDPNFKPVGEFTPSGEGVLARDANAYVREQGKKAGGEAILIFDGNGLKLSDGTGSKNNVGWSPEAADKFLEPGADLVIHHNHPSNASFSRADVTYLAYPGMSVVWAHGNEANVYRASLPRALRGQNPNKLAAAISTAYTAADEVVYNEMSKLTRAGKLAPNLGTKIYYALVSQALHDAGLIDYFSDFVPAMPAGLGMLGILKKATKAAQFYGEVHLDANVLAKARGPDRGALAVRHVGDMGIPSPYSGGSSRGRIFERGYAGDGTTPDRGQAAGVAEPGLSDSIALRTGEEDLSDFGINPGERVRVRDIAEAFQARQREKFGKIDFGDHSPEAKEKLSEWLANEVKFELQPENIENSAFGWYTEKFQRALDTFSQKYPELAHDQDARDLMTMLFAVTSDGQRVVDNFRIADQAYGHYRSTGKMPIPEGVRRTASITKNLARIQELIGEHGVRRATEYLLTEKPVSAINKVLRAEGKKINSKIAADEIMPMSAVEFGPKLGAFYANLMGTEGYLTMDMWWTRTFNRMRGTLLKKPSEVGLRRVAELIRVERGLQRPPGGAQLMKVIKEQRNAYKKKGYENGTELEMASNTIYKDAFEGIEEAPLGAKDRSFMISVAKEVQKKLVKSDHNATISDIQAMLWYYEKRLYGEMGARQSDDISYEEAAQRAVEGVRTGERAEQGPRGADARGARQGSASADDSLAGSFAQGERQLPPNRDPTIPIRLQREGMEQTVNVRRKSVEAIKSELAKFQRYRQSAGNRTGREAARAGEAVMGERANRGRRGVLADRSSRIDTAKELMSKAQQNVQAEIDDLRLKAEEKILAWEGKSAGDAQAALKRRKEQERIRDLKKEADVYQGKDERLTGADRAVDAAIKRIIKSDRDLSEGELLSLADEIVDRIIGSPDGRLPYDLPSGGPKMGPPSNTPPPRGPLAHRQFMIPDENIKNWLVADPEQIAHTYLGSVVPDVLLTERFGDVDMTQQFREVNEEYAAKSRNAGSEAERQAIRKEQERVIADMAAGRDRIRGTYGFTADTVMRNAARIAGAAGSVNTLADMGGSALSQITDLSGPVFMHGFGATFRDGYMPFFKALTEGKSSALSSARRQYNAMGIAVDMVHNSRNLDEVGEQYHPRTKGERMLKGAAQGYMNLNLSAPATDFAKTIAAIVTGNELFRATKAVVDGTATPKQITNLAASSIDEEMAGRIWQSFNESGMVKDGVYLPNTESWSDQAARRAFEGAVSREVNIAVVTPGQEKALWLSNPVLKILGQFKAFIASSSVRILAANLQKRDAQSLQGVIAAIGLGMIGYKAYTVATGQEASDRWQDWVKEGASRSGVLGWLDEGNSFVSKFTRGQMDLYRAIGADRPLSRYASRGVLGALLGPTGGKIENLAQAVGAAASGEFISSDTHAARRLAPLQNLFYIRRLINQVEEGFNDAFGIKQRKSQ